jgi:hypothetical protein
LFPVSSGPATNLDANGSTALKNNIININPYIGYRIPLAKIKLDILAGTDIGFISSTHEKGSAKGTDGKAYSTDLDRTTIKKDFRLRFGLAASLNKFSINASYAHGLSNYMEGYLGGSPEAYSRVVQNRAWLQAFLAIIFQGAASLLSTYISFSKVAASAGNDSHYLNLIAFTGDMRLTSILGTINTSRHTTSVPIFNNITSLSSIWIGTKVM